MVQFVRGGSATAPGQIAREDVLTNVNIIGISAGQNFSYVLLPANSQVGDTVRLFWAGNPASGMPVTILTSIGAAAATILTPVTVMETNDTTWVYQ